MITYTVLGLLGILLAVVLWQMLKGGGAKNRQVTAPVMPAAVAAPTLASARAGDVVSVPGAAEDFSDLDFTIERRNRYETGPNRWTELTGDHRGRRVWIEVSPGRDTEVVGFFDPRRPTIAEVGVSEDELGSLDQAQDPSRSVFFDGRAWNYESSREIGFFENEMGEGEGFYRWLFKEASGRHVLCIEKWEGDPFDVRIGQRLNQNDIVVFRAA